MININRGFAVMAYIYNSILFILLLLIPCLMVHYCTLVSVHWFWGYCFSGISAWRLM